MPIFDPVPPPSECECSEPGCPGWFVNNIETQSGRFYRDDVKLLLHRKNLAKLPRLMMALMRKYGVDHLEKELCTELNRLMSDLTSPTPVRPGSR